MKKIIPQFVSFVFIFMTHAFAVDLRTIAEKSEWKQTGRANETESLCHAFAKSYPTKIKCSIYGKTPEGRNLVYMLAGDLSLKSPLIWVQAGIHAGEIDGKDAVFLLLREILEGKIKPNPLSNLTLAFIPIVNLDGHERFGKWNRPNQIGPEEMGWRTTAQNYNMNRDFIKTDAPEMQAMLKLWHKLDPIFSLDLHVTDGADFQPEVGLVLNPNTSHGKSPLHKLGSELETNLVNALKSQGHLPLPYYPTFEKDNDPLSGFSRYVSTPRFSQGYWYNQNRLGMLVETHSWKNYANRVKTHHDIVLESLRQAQQKGKEWIKAAQEWDHQNLAGSDVELEYKHTEESHLIDFAGYRYTIEKSAITNDNVVHYFPHEPQTWKVPFYEILVSSLTLKAPHEGYFVPAAEAKWVQEKLSIHNIQYSVLKKEIEKKFEVFRAVKADFSPTSFEGHQTLTVKGEWKQEDRLLLAGSLFVPIHQKHVRLIMQLFEPQAKDSFLSWGFFNRAFEQKEYMEPYVAEEVAKVMLKDPKIKKEFENKLDTDPDFAKDSWKKWQFFHQKHPSWDEKFNLYPIYKK